MTPLLTGVFASQISGRLNTWAPTSAYDALGTVTVPSGGLSSITFAGIPQTGYSHLQMRIMPRTTSATTDDNVVGTFNGDTGGNYVTHYMNASGSGSVNSAIVGTNSTVIFFGRQPGASSLTNTFGVGVVDIFDYNNPNKFKTLKSLSGWDDNSTSQLWYWSGSWMNLNPINSITINGPFAQHSHFALYGVK